MTTLNESDAALWSHWHAAVRQPAVDSAVRGVYRDVDEAVAARGPRCWISGKCCKFDEYGHRLYVTGLEIAWFLHQVEHASACVPEVHPTPLHPLNLAAGARDHAGCPWQINGLCTAHNARPLGCRVFFCEKGTQQWQQELYERMMAGLRAIHQAHDIPYRYMEWRQGLADAAQISDGAI